MRGRLGELRKAPWTLWAEAGLGFVGLAIAVVAGADTAWPLLVYFAVFLIVINYFLLRGNRIVWWFLVLAGGAGLAVQVVMAAAWHQFPLAVASLGLLLAPPSWRYVRPWRKRRARTRARDLPEGPPQISCDPDDQDDASRPAGWYFDPSDPRRMRYWHPGLGGWQSKTTRAPRTLRRAREAEPD